MALCKSGKFVNFDTATSKITCAVKPASATNVTNCTTHAYTGTGSSWTAKCVRCADTKTSDTTGNGNANCNGTAPTNCTSSHTKDECLLCKSGFAVKSDDTSCVAFTTDANCRKLAADSSCAECTGKYIFDKTKCVAAS